MRFPSSQVPLFLQIWGDALESAFLIRTPDNHAVKHFEKHDISIVHLSHVRGGNGCEETKR